MQASEAPYYKINRVVLKTLGLWPYQQSCLVRIQNALFIVILTSFFMVQLLVLVTTHYSTNVLFRDLSFTFTTILVATKYCVFVVRANSVKQLLDKTHEDWNSLKDKMEINIITKYACDGRFFTILTMSFCYSGIIICGIFQCLPLILDIILPLNESRPIELVVRTEYLISQEKYFYAILIHELITGCIGLTTMCCIIATLMMHIYHACALFKIASHRIKNAVKESALEVPAPKRNYLIYRRITHAVAIHQRAMDFVEYLTSVIGGAYIIIIIFGVSSLSLHLFQFLQLVTLTDKSEMFIFAIMVITHLGYMFIAHYGGQEITEHGIEMFKTTYNVPWYTSPLRAQKLLLFIMQKGTRNVTLTCASLFVLSLASLASMISTAVSYLTVIYSTR